MDFVWDPQKAGSNADKHGVAFEEAATVFEDSLAAIFEDEGHSDEEAREITIGHSTQGRVLVVSFIERAEAIRIIRVGSATPRERRDYEENWTF